VILYNVEVHNISVGNLCSLRNVLYFSEVYDADHR